MDYVIIAFLFCTLGAVGSYLWWRDAVAKARKLEDIARQDLLAVRKRASLILADKETQLRSIGVDLHRIFDL